VDDELVTKRHSSVGRTEEMLVVGASASAILPLSQRRSHEGPLDPDLIPILRKGSEALEAIGVLLFSVLRSG
jgi:hypothetical protein